MNQNRPNLKFEPVSANTSCFFDFETIGSALTWSNMTLRYLVWVLLRHCLTPA